MSNRHYHLLLTVACFWKNDFPKSCAGDRLDISHAAARCGTVESYPCLERLVRLFVCSHRFQIFTAVSVNIFWETSKTFLCIDVSTIFVKWHQRTGNVAWGTELGSCLWGLGSILSTVFVVYCTYMESQWCWFVTANFGLHMHKSASFLTSQ
jgi:hypothetical protein